MSEFKKWLSQAKQRGIAKNVDWHIKEFFGDAYPPPGVKEWQPYITALFEQIIKEFDIK